MVLYLNLMLAGEALPRHHFFKGAGIRIILCDKALVESGTVMILRFQTDKPGQTV